MCGILGRVVPHDNSNLKGGLYYSAAMKMRGPDAIEECAHKNISFLHFRLSTWGGEANRQPVFYKNTILLFNGQIYNYVELVQKYLQHVLPVSEGDAIARLIYELGFDVVNEFDGPFAIVYYDPNKSEVSLFRDCWGRKPLFYNISEKELLFSSLLEDIALNFTEKNINDDDVRGMLISNVLASPNSLLTGVSQVCSGERITFKITGSSIIKAQSLKFSLRSKKIDKRSPIELDNFRHLLEKSYFDRQRGFNKSWLALSGGLDSSILAAIANKSEIPTATVTLKFEDGSYDESIRAENIAQALGHEHHTIPVTSDLLENSIIHFIENVDIPVFDPAVILVSIISQYVKKQGGHVLITGDGADELFMGYRYFEAVKYIHNENFIKRNIGRAILKIISVFPESSVNMGLAYTARRLLPAFGHDSDSSYFSVLAPFNIHTIYADKCDIKSKLLGALNLDGIDSESDHYFRIRNGMLQRYLSDLQTVKLDRGSMHNSIDIRNPFLSLDVSSLALNIPLNQIINQGKGKYILHKLHEHYFSKILLKNEYPKRGFRFPIGDLFRTNLFAHCQLEFKKDNYRLNRYVPIKKANNILDNHLRGKRDYSKELWALFVLNKWFKKYLS